MDNIIMNYVYNCKLLDLFLKILNIFFVFQKYYKCTGKYIIWSSDTIKQIK